MKYRFVLKNEANLLLAKSEVYTEVPLGNTPTLNQNLSRWIAYGFPGHEGEDNGAGIIVPGDVILVEFVD